MSRGLGKVEKSILALFRGPLALVALPPELVALSLFNEKLATNLPKRNPSTEMDRRQMRDFGLENWLADQSINTTPKQRHTTSRALNSLVRKNYLFRVFEHPNFQSHVGKNSVYYGVFCNPIIACEEMRKMWLFRNTLNRDNQYVFNSNIATMQYLARPVEDYKFKIPKGMDDHIRYTHREIENTVSLSQTEQIKLLNQIQSDLNANFSDRLASF